MINREDIAVILLDGEIVGIVEVLGRDLGGDIGRVVANGTDAEMRDLLRNRYGAHEGDVFGSYDALEFIARADDPANQVRLDPSDAIN